MAPRTEPLIPGSWAEDTQVSLGGSKKKVRGGNLRGEGTKLTAELGTRETVERN